MKKKCLYTLTIIMIFIFSVNIYADDKKTTSNVFLISNIINTDRQIDEGGDVYAFAQNIHVNNNVNGNLISAGQSLYIKSDKVDGHIRGAGQDINLDVKSTNNITLAAQNINIEKLTNCNKIYAAAKTFKFQGESNELYIKSQDVVIDGVIKDNLNVECENIIIGENAKLLGSVNIKSPHKATIYGNHDLESIQYEKAVFKEIHNKFRLMPILINFLSAILVGLFIYILFKNYFNNCNNIVSTHIGKYILSGLLIFIIFPILFILLCMSIIGIPIALILLIVYIVLMYISHIIVGIVLGKFILKGYNPYLQLIIGICLIKILIWIPLIGFIFGLCCILFTLGLILLKALSLFK